MHNRLRLLKAATALMYFGALLAGLIGHGWAMVPAFVAVFVLWSVILRPHLWPDSLQDLRQSGAAVAVASLLATQSLLVILCFAIGRGVGGVLRFQPNLPDFLPLAIAFMSVPLSRMIWNPRVMAENLGVDPLAPAPAAQPLATREQVTQMLGAVMALPDSVTEEDVQTMMTAISVQGDPAAIRQVLVGALVRRKLSRAGRMAMILHATDPTVSALTAGSGYLAQAFAAAGQDGALLTLYAGRCGLILAEDPDLAMDCPDGRSVARAAKAGGADGVPVLRRLVGLLEQDRAMAGFPER